METEMQEKFNEWNISKFNNKLPRYEIRFRNMRCFGNIDFKKKIIKLNPKYPDTMLNTLLHEMVHAEMNRRGYRNKGHSLKFWKMFVEKGGKITEINRKLFVKANMVYEKDLEIH